MNDMMKANIIVGVIVVYFIYSIIMSYVAIKWIKKNER